MQMRFSNEEMRWVDTSAIPWKIKEGCPQAVRKKLLKAIKYRYDTKPPKNS